MPSTICTGCGQVTNTATSDFWRGTTLKEIGIATVCYVAFVDGKWVEGCAYDSIDDRRKMRLQKLLANKERINDFEV